MQPKYLYYDQVAGDQDGSGGAGGASGAGGNAGAGGTAGTGGDGGGDSGGGAKWPDTWRQELSRGDEKELKQLERYASPVDIWKKSRALEQRLSSGELRSALSKDAKPEEVAQWRTENGIPSKPEEYDIKLDGGVVIGETDKPMVDEFLKSAHMANMHPNQVKETLAWYYKNLDARQQKLEQDDATFKKQAEDTLRADWGNDYRPNINMIGNLLETAPPTLKDRLMNARLADGRPLGNDPDALKWLAGLAREVNPVATVVPGSGTTQAAGVEDEIAQIEKFMREKRPEYNKDEAKQERLRLLYEARERLATKH